MYGRNDAQKRRKQNYERYQRLSEQGYSVAEESAQSALYYINEDPFGRTYYQKALGEVSVRDPMTGRTYTQEEWATKEFIIDNKAQLINKVSADLIAGKRLSIKFEDADHPPEDLVTWLEEFAEYNHLPTRIPEAAMRNSALGDQYFELSIEDGEIKVAYIEPHYVDISFKHDEILFYELAWEIEIEVPEKGMFAKGKKKVKKYVQKKIHYPGKIRWELYEMKGEEFIPVPLATNPDNLELLEKAAREPNFKILIADEDSEVGEKEVDDIAFAFFVEEFTGVDEPLLIHWPNYKMFEIFGVSDNGVIENLQNALNNRETQLNDILDKHGDPAMYGDASFLDLSGNLEMSGGGGRFFPVQQGDSPPGYLEWGGKIADSHREVERLYKAILDNTETSPALLGDDKGGTQSGRALMYKLIRSLAMATRKSTYMKNAFSKLVQVAQKLKIVWIDGVGVTSVDQEVPTEWEDVLVPTFEIQSSIPTDTRELIDLVVKLVTTEIITKETGLRIIEKLFDEIDVDEELVLLAAEFEKKKELAAAAIPDLLAGISNEIPPEGEPGD